MRVLLARLSILSVCVLAVSAEPARGQSPGLTSAPRLVRFTGSFRPADGQPPAPVDTMTLSIYGEETGGVPLWQETQTVAVNPDGRFTLLMGSTRPDGLPLDLFASGEPRWLAVHVDHVERPGEGEPERVLLPSVDIQGVVRKAAGKLRNQKKRSTWRLGTRLVPNGVQLDRPENFDFGACRVFLGGAGQRRGRL